MVKRFCILFCLLQCILEFMKFQHSAEYLRSIKALNL